MCRSSCVVLVWLSFSVATSAQTKLDRYGDPLPEGALMRLGTVRLRHPGVGHVTFSPDGSALASSGGGVIRLWDMRTSRQIAVLMLSEYMSECSQCAFSADGRRLAVAHGHEHVAVWDAATGELITQARLKHRVRTEYEAAFSSDLQIMACVGFQDEAMFVFKVATGEELLRLPFGGEPVFGRAVLSRDGKQLAVGNGFTKTICLWDLEAALKPGGKKDPKVIRLDKDHKVAPVAFTADGKGLITCGVRENDVKNELGHSLGFAEIGLWDLAKEKLVYIYNAETMTDLVPDCAGRLSHDGQRILAGFGEKLTVWDVASRKLVRTIDVTESRSRWWSPPRMDISPRGHIALVRDDRLHFWDAATGKRLFDVPPGHNVDVRSLAVSSDGKHVASGDTAGFVHLWDALTGNHLRELRFSNQWVHSLRFARDGKALVVSGGATSDGLHYHGVLKIWNVADGKELHSLTFDGRVHAMAVSPDGRTVALETKPDRIASTGGTDPMPAARGSPAVDLLDISSGKVLLTIDMAWDVAFSDGGNRLTGVRRDASGRHLCVWDVATGKLLEKHMLDEHFFVSALHDYSPDGKWVVRAYLEPEVTVWDVASRTRTATLSPETSRNRVAISRDGRLVAVSGYHPDPRKSGRVSLFDAKTARELLTRGTDTWTGALAFSPDGQTLFGGTGQGTVLAWDVREAHHQLEKAK